MDNLRTPEVVAKELEQLAADLRSGKVERYQAPKLISKLANRVERA